MVRKWTDEEIRCFEDLSWEHEVTEIAKILGRSCESVYEKRSRLIATDKWKGASPRKYGVPGERFKGCDRDCERCCYSDCLIPDSLATVGLDVNSYLRK